MTQDKEVEPEPKKAYLRLEISQQLHRRFKARCSAEGESMNRKAVELIEKWIAEAE